MAINANLVPGCFLEYVEVALQVAWHEIQFSVHYTASTWYGFEVSCSEIITIHNQDA